MTTKQFVTSIPSLGTVKCENNGKRIIAFQRYEGNNLYYIVWYYDDAIDNSPIPCCCQSPTKAKTEAGALRKINNFLK